MPVARVLACTLCYCSGCSVPTSLSLSLLPLTSLANVHRSHTHTHTHTHMHTQKFLLIPVRVLLCYRVILWRINSTDRASIYGSMAPTTSAHGDPFLSSPSLPRRAYRSLGQAAVTDLVAFMYRESNKMHGDGMFVDGTGRQWKGKFYNGQGPGLHTLPANNTPQKNVSPEPSQ